AVDFIRTEQDHSLGRRRTYSDSLLDGRCADVARSQCIGTVRHVCEPELAVSSGSRSARELEKLHLHALQGLDAAGVGDPPYERAGKGMRRGRKACSKHTADGECKKR